MRKPGEPAITVRRLTLGGLLGLAFLAVPLQVIIDPSMENIASACLVLASSISILLYIAWTRALELQPLSTFAIFGFCATTQLGALLAQTAAWTPLRALLYAPIYTFGVLAFYQAIALLVHAAYTFVLKRKNPHHAPVRWLLDKAGLYDRPAAGTLWIMGIVGLSSFALYGGKDAISKAVHAFEFLTWAPFLIPLYIRDAGDSYCSARRATPFLIMYALAICLLGVAVNARGIMFLGAVTIGLSYLFVSMRSTAPARVKRSTLLKLGALGLTGIALAGPLADLATAMAIARAHRGKVGALEMMANTFDAWRSPYLIAQYRALDNSFVTTAYDEVYIANPMVARFVETKFHDNSLHFASTLTTEDSKNRLRSITIANLWAILPTPILKLLHINVDKADLNFSMGDYLVYLSRGVPLGGRKTGSVFAEGITLMGPMFPFLYAGLLICIYGWMDLLTVRPKVGLATMTALAKMCAWDLFIYGVTAEAITGMVIFIVRESFQIIMVYLLIYNVARLILHRPQHASDARGAFDGKYGR